MTSRCLLVFLKAPVPGRVKTRLAAGIGARAAARAYVAMARLVREQAEAVRGSRVLWVYDPAPDYPDLAWLGPRKGQTWPQGPGDLGARLKAAFCQAFACGATAVCAIGTDSPDLAARRIEAAFKALDRHDLVLGPSTDGGYYLLGLRRFHAELFRQVPWSSPRTLKVTRERARALGLSVHTLPPLMDVDLAADLAQWLAQ